MTRSGADSCGGSRGNPRPVDRGPGPDGMGRLPWQRCPGCPDCTAEVIHSPPVKPRYRAMLSPQRAQSRKEGWVYRDETLIASCHNPTDAALIVKLLNENEGRTK